MSLPSIGAHCALESCHVNDFLPICCPCDLLFCKDHISPEAHSCALLQAHDDLKTHMDPEKKLQRCAADKCNKPSLEAFIADNENADGRTPAVCPRCKQAFCATHREPASHACTAPDLSKPRNEAGRAILAKMFPAKTGSSSSTPAKTVPAKRKPPVPLNPKKVAQLRQVELMKMRHRAQPGDPKDKDKHVPVEEKLHVKVRAEDKEEKILWFRKTMGTGKALDLIASHFRVSIDRPLQLATLDADAADEVVLHNDQLLASQVEDGSQLILKG